MRNYVYENAFAFVFVHCCLPRAIQLSSCSAAPARNYCLLLVYYIKVALLGLEAWNYVAFLFVTYNGMPLTVSYGSFSGILVEPTPSGSITYTPHELTANDNSLKRQENLWLRPCACVCKHTFFWSYKLKAAQARAQQLNHFVLKYLSVALACYWSQIQIKSWNLLRLQLDVALAP